jgi:coenzyme F420-reducing hydrogenase delta subunit/NAD-dependent dihydropyrimidine dehydrogenase PreA subunit
MDGYEPRIVGYLCTWCSYTGADSAGTSRLKYPSNLRAVRVPCSGRVSPEIIMRTFDQGADGVLVLGCHIGECHYDTGNHRTAKRLPILRMLMEFAGLEPQRIKLDWVSASEGERFSRIVNEFTETVRALGPARWRVPSSPTLLPKGEGNRFPRLVRESTHGQFPFDIRHSSAIQAKAKELLESGQVECVIGYEVGPRGRTRPAFVRQPGEVERLAWNPACTHNLTTYLHEAILPRSAKPGTPPKRVAVVVKPCDSRAINVLLAENQIARENVHVIGVACDGILEGAGFEPVADGRLQARCQQCAERMPVVYDTLIGQPPVVDVTDQATDVAWLEAMTPKQRTGFWLSQFDRCIRCYACRQACPMCNCPTCLYERDDSLWVGLGIRPDEKKAFHLGRAYHLAGRCIGCNECERVCPMNIPISLLNRKLAKEMQAAFDYRAGVAPTPSPFVTILGGEEA